MISFNDFPEKLIKWKSVDKDCSVTKMRWNYFLLALTIRNCFKEFSARFYLYYVSCYLKVHKTKIKKFILGEFDWKILKKTTTKITKTITKTKINYRILRKQKVNKV